MDALSGTGLWAGDRAGNEERAVERTDPRQGAVITQAGHQASPALAPSQEGKAPRGPGIGRWRGPCEGVPDEGGPDGSSRGCGCP